jgi:PncC family amidohydrolase
MTPSDAPESQLGELLKARKWTITTAESCTGGLIMHRLTNVSGSSAYILGGIVTYSNEMKMKFLNVQSDTLIQYGAVSEQTAREMAHGARALFGASIAVSVTGIAGPGGGTTEKPVGLTYIGLSAEGLDQEVVRRFVWSGSREENKASSAGAALELALSFLRGE